MYLENIDLFWLLPRLHEPFWVQAAAAALLRFFEQITKAGKVKY